MDDLLSLNTGDLANKGAVMEVLHPAHRTPLIWHDGVAVSITLLGKDSDVYVAADNEARAKAVEGMQEGARWSAAESALQFAKTLAKCTIGWHGIPGDWVHGDGSTAEAECTFENAVKLYQNKGISWLREQADKFVGTRANFMKASLSV